VQGTVTLEGTSTGYAPSSNTLHVGSKSAAVTNGASYRITGLTPGQSRVWASSLITNGTWFTWPDQALLPGTTNPQLTLVAGEIREFSPHAKLAGTLSGTLAITGVASLIDVSEAYRRIGFAGSTGSVTYGGYTYQGGLNVNNGAFTLAVTAGSWSYHGLSYTVFQRNLADPETYVNCTHYGIFDGRQPTYVVAEGQSIDGISLTMPTGSVKIRFAVTDGSLVSSPALQFTYNGHDSSERRPSGAAELPTVRARRWRRTRHH